MIEIEQKLGSRGRIIPKDDVTVVIPTLNEEGAIQKVVRETKAAGFQNIIVVDGWSSDRTAVVAKEEGVPVLFQEGKGKSDALMTAVPRIPTPYTLVMDGDNTYDPASIDRLLAKGDYYDEVIGVRDRKNIPRLHRFGNRVITRVFNLLFDTSLHDVCSGMYLVRTDILREFDFSSKGFSLEVGVAAHTASVSRRVTETAIPYRERIGKPKLSSLHGFQIMLDSIRLAWSYNPAFLIFLMASFLIVPSFFILGWVGYKYLTYGVSHFVWAIVGTVGAGVGVISAMLSVVCLFVKRMEFRVLERLRNGKDKSTHH